MRARTLSAFELAFSWRPRHAGERLPEAALEVLQAMRLRVELNEGRKRDVATELGTPDQTPDPKRNKAGPLLPIDEGRVANCNLSVAFGHVFEAPCLAAPRRDDWVATLKGRTVGFVGDSVLRDLFLFMCLVLSRSLRRTNGALQRRRVGQAPGRVDAWAGRSLGRGTGVAGSFMRADFAVSRPRPLTCLGCVAGKVAAVLDCALWQDGISLRWCWYNDAACVAHELLTADLLIAHYGAHCAPLSGRCGIFHWPLLPEPRPASAGASTGKGTTPPNATRFAPKASFGANGDLQASFDANGVSFAAADALRAFHARSALVWMEYPAPHFRDGLGEFEDYWLNLGGQNASRARQGPTPWHANPFSCQPLGPCTSAMTAWRLSFRDLFHREGVPLLRAWDVSLDRSEVHPGQSPAPGLNNAAKRFISDLGGKRAPDCRHTCVPSSVVLAWSRLLFAMLQPAPSADGGRCAGPAAPRWPSDAPATADALSMADGTPYTCADAAAAVDRERLSDLTRVLVPHAEGLEMSCDPRLAAGRDGVNPNPNRGASRRDAQWQSPRCACLDACSSDACGGGGGGAKAPQGGSEQQSPPPPSKPCKLALVDLLCRRKCSYQSSLAGGA